MKAARESGLSPSAFAVFWSLCADTTLHHAGVDPMHLARDVQTLLDKFPHAAVNAEEQRHLRAGLYKPLLKQATADRTRIVESIIATLLRQPTP